MSKTALIIGAGSGISGAFAKELADEGYSVCLACRNTDKLKDLSIKISATAFKTDCSREESILRLFDHFDANFGIPDLVLYNCGSRVRGKIHEIDRHLIRIVNVKQVSSQVRSRLRGLIELRALLLLLMRRPLGVKSFSFDWHPSSLKIR